MTAQFGFLRRVAALALCLGVMLLTGGQGAWAMSCPQAAEIVDAMYSKRVGAGSNGIPGDYNPPCQLPPGRIMAIQATESGPDGGAGTTSWGGARGCGQLIGHTNPIYKKGSETLRYDLQGNNVHNLLRAGEYLCYLQDFLKTDRCDIIAAAYNAGEGTIGSGIRLNKVYGKPDTLENILAAGVPIYYPNVKSKTDEALGHAGCTCGGDLQQKYVAAGRYCKPSGGGIGAFGTALLALDKITDVGAGVIQALASVVETAVVLFDKHLGPALLSVVMVIYSIMALWAIAKLLMPFGPPGNAGQTMNGLLTLTGTVGVVALMLNNLSFLTSLVFFPIMSLMTELADLSATPTQSAQNAPASCARINGDSLSGDAGKDAKLLATRMTCTVDQAIAPMKQVLRISMATLKRLEGLDLGVVGLLPMADLVVKQIILASAIPLALMSATAILGVIATTAQAFWKIAFEFFKLAPIVAAFAFRPTRGVFTTSVKGWISPIMTFAVIYSILGMSSGVVCGMELGKTDSGPITLCDNFEGYVQGISQAPYSVKSEVTGQKEGTPLFPAATKSIWISLAFFTIFINSSLRLAAKMDWVGGGGLADGLQKLVSNTLGNMDHYKAAGEKTVLLSADVAQNVAFKSGERKKPDSDKPDSDKPKPDGDDEKPEGSTSSTSANRANYIKNFRRSGAAEGAPQRTPVA